MDLNDDCLLLIFKLLSLKDQISAALACSRFRSVLSYLWQTTYTNLSLNFGIEDITVKEFAVLIKGISDTVQQMRLRDLTFERLAVLKLYKYPNLTKFSFTQWSRCPLGDDCILEMTKIFPKLRSFSPHGPFTGKHMENWKYLQYLNLTYCANVNFSHMETIFEKLLLKSVQLNIFERHYTWTSERAFRNFCNLEVIFLNTTELDWLSDILKFTNLRELTITDRDTKGPLQEFLKNFNQHKYNDVIELETILNFPFYGTQVCEFVQLRKLVVLSQDISAYIGIQNYATNLREVVFKCCEVSIPTELSMLLIKSTKIEFLSIEQCSCGFRDLRVNAKEITQRRSKQLHLNFYENTYIDNNSPTFVQFVVVALTVEGSDPLLKITGDISTPASFHPLYIHFR